MTPDNMHTAQSVDVQINNCYWLSDIAELCIEDDRIVVVPTAGWVHRFVTLDDDIDGDWLAVISSVCRA